MQPKLLLSCLALAAIAGCGAGSSPECAVKDFYRASRAATTTAPSR
jgi:uncharacterized lipoprotein